MQKKCILHRSPETLEIRKSVMNYRILLITHGIGKFLKMYMSLTQIP